MNIVSRAPFRLLGAHGVAPEQVQVLERQFGPLFPGNVSGPDDAMVWMLNVLPWDRTVTPLRTWLTLGHTKAQITDDTRARRAMALVVSMPDHDATMSSMREMQELLTVLGRVRGVSPVEAGYDINDDRLSDEFRAWVATYSGVAAAHCAVCREGHANSYTQTLAAHTAFNWVLSQTPTEWRELAVNRCLQDLVGTLTTFVGSWVKGGDA